MEELLLELLDLDGTEIFCEGFLDEIIDQPTFFERWFWTGRTEL